MGGCNELPIGERLRDLGRTVSSEVNEAWESSELPPRSFPVPAGGRDSVSSDFLGLVTSCRNDETEDLSDRTLDFPVKALLVRECSELPEDRDGDSRDRSEAETLVVGDFKDSLPGDEPLDMRS